MEIKQITITKVVSTNFIMDLVSSFQNMVGTNLTPYEKMINRGMSQIQKELRVKLDWYRYEITQLTNGAVSITLYGETSL